MERDGELLRRLQELVAEREAALQELEAAQEDNDAGSDDRCVTKLGVLRPVAAVDYIIVDCL